MLFADSHRFGHTPRATLEDARAMLVEFLGKYSGRVRCALLSGSIVSGSNTTLSDIDGIIITEEGETPTRRQMFVRNRPLQLWVVDVFTAFQMLSAAARSRDPYFIYSVGHSIHVAGEEALSDSLKAEALRLYQSEIPFPPSARARYGADLSAGMIELEKATSRNERTCIATSMLLLVQELLVYKTTGWKHRRDHATRALETTAPQQLQILFDSFHTAVADDEYADFLSVVQTLAEPIAPLRWETAYPLR